MNLRKKNTTRNLHVTETFILPRVSMSYGKRTREFYIPFYFNQFVVDPEIATAGKAKRKVYEWVQANIQ